ncbi:MAG: hypothetical protein ACE5HK_00445 [Candidatus Methylomirabilales bacterium]
MAEGMALLRRLKPGTRRVRLLRGFYYGIRGAGVGLVVSLILLMFQEAIPFGRWWLLLPIPVVGFAGFVGGLLRPLRPLEVARLVEEHGGFEQRLSTALEVIHGGEESAFGGALLRETTSCLEHRMRPPTIPVTLPREGLYLLPVGLAVVALLVLPSGLPRLIETNDRVQEEARATTASETLGETVTPPAGDSPRAEPPRVQDRHLSRGLTPPSKVPGEIAALFKDAPLGQSRPDFSLFLREGDERLKFLGRMGAIPELKTGNLRSPYQIAMAQLEAMRARGDARSLSGDQVRRLLMDMKAGKPGRGQLGSAQGTFGEEDLGNLEGEAGLQALQDALDELRESEEAGLFDSQVPPGRGSGTREGQGPSGGDDAMTEEGGSRESMGSFAGRGRGSDPEGEQAQRIPTAPWDSGLKGRRGKRGQSEAYNTNMVGPGSQGKGQLPQIQLLTEYRQMVETALTKEAVPPAYREQVKRYFDFLKPPEQALSRDR